jgi:hypothetical protein
MKPQVISPKFIYPKQTMKKDFLYRVYGKVDDKWMTVGKALICFGETIFSGFNFVSSLSLDLRSNIFRINFISSVCSVNNFNIQQISCVINKNVWGSFYNWVDMKIAKKDT